ncbi:MAG: 1-deoxy-D-xylulose-5-phosphate synthase [Bacteroidales bacterium]|nr:1-deoxy-D-xylulose-5-phosphate synthase [Bacteroidales bacterium]
MTPASLTFLNKIDSPSDLRKLSHNSLVILASELRNMLLNSTAVNPGHLSASLGVVELTIAIHYLFDTPVDTLIWDVGHQTYPHKILTGRQLNFESLRKLNGISGFPSRAESEYDAFGTGHSSTALSAALGMAMAAKIRGDQNRQHIAVVGDGAMNGGMFFEALNQAGELNPNLLIILNDNGISIDKSVGALRNYLLDQSDKQSLNDFSNPFFEAFDVQCFGPLDGNNLEELLPALEAVKKIKGLRLLHVLTTKGKGNEVGEEVHKPSSTNENPLISIETTIHTAHPLYQDVFGETMVELAQQNEKIVAITPAMLSGSSLMKMKERFPDRTYDVGIAEQHAVTFAAGLAIEGMLPYCTIYSTFLQRGYDQLIHDVAIQNLPVIFCIDRAGLVGEDGATHHGVFDLSYLRCIPNLSIAAPMDETELRNLLYSAQFHKNGPYAIRYPRGKTENTITPKQFKKIETGSGRNLRYGEYLAVVSIGQPGNAVITALDQLQTEGIHIAHYDLRFVKPLDTHLLHEVFSGFKKVLTVEDGSIAGGAGSALVEFANDHGYQNVIKRLGIPDRFIPQGSPEELKKMCGFDVDTIILEIRSLLAK